jgi:hypothetical protein
MLVCRVDRQGRGRLSGSVHADGIEQHEPLECRLNIPSAYTEVVGYIERLNAIAVAYLEPAFIRFQSIATTSFGSTAALHDRQKSTQSGHN